MKIVVDTARCEGHGLCVEKAPLTLDLDDDGFLVVLDEDGEVPEERVGPALEAVAVCPVAALRAS